MANVVSCAVFTTIALHTVSVNIPHICSRTQKYTSAAIVIRLDIAHYNIVFVRFDRTGATWVRLAPLRRGGLRILISYIRSHFLMYSYSCLYRRVLAA